MILKFLEKAYFTTILKKISDAEILYYPVSVFTGCWFVAKQ